MINALSVAKVNPSIILSNANIKVELNGDVDL